MLQRHNGKFRLLECNCRERARKSFINNMLDYLLFQIVEYKLDSIILKLQQQLQINSTILIKNMNFNSIKFGRILNQLK